MSDGTDRARASVRRFTWPIALVAGLLLVAFSLVPWGVSDQGVQPSITGLGRVSVPGAEPGDVAFLEEHTLRPGLATVVLGTVIAVVAALAWWRPRLRWPAVVIVGLGAVAALVAAIPVLADPAAHLFDERVNDALSQDSPLVGVGYGLVGVTVVSIVLIGLVVAVALTPAGGSS
ncbi:hypothetical protein [Gordonia rhizosphera]|uniref:Uncharacterized protein n=1 Tax=Gordonia rhizosphera NBRC 16068 TaxID=1108045 RepID=K6V1E9_9ACTN|nr:hypothetical protein [Gordonia rhizosphera]GAB89743.1 hypothetical protein GORHZ_069_01220 [Gordonia rhizosphera NBRC 16068]